MRIDLDEIWDRCKEQAYRAHEPKLKFCRRYRFLPGRWAVLALIRAEASLRFRLLAP